MATGTTETSLNLTTESATNVTAYTSFNPLLLVVMQATGISILILYIFGLFINITAFYVLLQAKKKLSTEYIFTVLTFADMMALLTGVVISLVYTLIAFSALSGALFDLRNIVSRTDIVAYMGPYSITIIVAIERMFAVFRPIDFRNTWTPEMGKIAASLGYVSTLLLYIIFAASLDKNDFLVARIIFIATSVISVVIATIITIVQLKKHVSKIGPSNQQNGNVSNSIARERRQTKVLIGISTLFVICGSATLADTTASFLATEDFEFAFALFMSGSTRAIFQILNSTLNCVIYVAANPAFKDKFVNILCCCN